MKTTPLILFAFDGADMALLRQWASEGYLPTTSALLARGCFAKTCGPELITEHGIWISMLCGVSHTKHGYYNFRQLRPGTYDLHSIEPCEAKATPLWNELRDKRVAVLDAPEMLPIKGLRGVQLANWATHRAANATSGASSEPPELVDRALQFFGPQTSILEFKPDSTPAEDREELRRMLERVKKKGALFRELMGAESFDFTLVGFYEAHAAAHRFWKYRPESPLSKKYPDAPDLAHGIRDVYQAVDRELGLLIERAGGMEANNVVLMTAFGMSDYYPTTALAEAFCRQLGYHVAPQSNGNAPRSFSPLSILRKILPHRLRVAISNCLPRDVQERLMAEQLRACSDWSRTTAFAIPAMYTSFIRVNLKGREPQGIVEPSQYAALLDRLEADLRALIDPVDGKPAVRKINRVCGTISDTPPEVMPDLFVEWKRADYYFERITHPRAELLQTTKIRYHRDSYHIYEGFFTAAGPSIGARGEIDPVSVLDFAPSMLALLGAAAPDSMPGKNDADRLTVMPSSIASGEALADSARH